MISERRRGRDSRPPDAVVVRVEHDHRGGWCVVMSESRVQCQTLDDARRLAYVYAARARPCEVIVHDAYHRVLVREVVTRPRAPGRRRSGRHGSASSVNS